MRRHFLQRWSVVLLLVSRLIFGELAHSTPHEILPPTDVVASKSVQPCAEHVGEHVGVAHIGAEHGAGDSAAASCAQVGSAHDADCCDTTACKCPCAHVAALAMPALAAELILFDQGRIPAFAARLAQQRPSELFRPPA